jgi:hypothetical protein
MIFKCAISTKDGLCTVRHQKVHTVWLSFCYKYKYMGKAMTHTDIYVNAFLLTDLLIKFQRQSTAHFSSLS